MDRRHVLIEELSLDYELKFHGKPDGIVPELYTAQQLCRLTAEAVERNLHFDQRRYGIGTLSEMFAQGPTCGTGGCVAGTMAAAFHGYAVGLGIYQDDEKVLSDTGAMGPWLGLEEDAYEVLFDAAAWQFQGWYDEANKAGLPIEGIGDGPTHSQREVQRRQAVLLRRLARRSDGEVTR